MYYPSACARAAPVACLQLSHYSLAILHADAAAAAVIANFSSRLRPSCACRCSSTVFSTSSRRPSLASSSCPAPPADTRQSERERPPLQNLIFTSHRTRTCPPSSASDGRRPAMGGLQRGAPLPVAVRGSPSTHPDWTVASRACVAPTPPHFRPLPCAFLAAVAVTLSGSARVTTRDVVCRAGMVKDGVLEGGAGTAVANEIMGPDYMGKIVADERKI